MSIYETKKGRYTVHTSLNSTVRDYREVLSDLVEELDAIDDYVNCAYNTEKIYAY